MKWDASAVAGFAVVAGFPRDYVGGLVAVAVTVTGGDDQWTWTDDRPGGPDFRGLFAVDATWFDPSAIGDLLDPTVNAQAACRAYVQAGGAWGWTVRDPDHTPGWARDAGERAAKSPTLAPRLPDWLPRNPTPGPTGATITHVRGLAGVVLDAARSLRNQH